MTRAWTESIRRSPLRTTPAPDAQGAPVSAARAEDGDPRRVESSFRLHLRRAMLWPLVALVAAAVGLVAVVSTLQRLNQLVDHTDVVIGRATLLERLVVERESRLRAYVVTGEYRYLEAYAELNERVVPTLDDVQALVVENGPQVARLASVRAGLARWQGYAERQLSRRPDTAAAQDIPFHLLDGEASSDYVRSRIREFIEVEEGLRVGRVARVDAVTRYAFLLGLGFALVIGPALALTTARRMRRSSQSYREALEAQERTARSLRESEEKLRDADRHKDEFLGMLSHELRNPLAPIRNSMHMLNHAPPGSDQAERARTVIARQVNHLARLVDDLLDVKRISTGKLRLRPSRMDLTQQVRESVEDMRPLFVSRSLSLELVAPRGPIWVLGDGTRLAQVVSNLLHNAAKFTDSGGHVTVTVESRDGHARVRVEDDGVGVPPEMLDQLFDQFVQSDRTLDRTGGGLGLGLSLVRGVMELHGGTVIARSDGVGKGTEFVVSMPVTEPPAPAIEAPAAPLDPGRRRVLIVEDNLDAAESLRDIVEMIGGHEVTVAHDGEAGVAAAEELAPDVILCDLGLPLVDGYEVARRIRSRGRAAGARLVALSGYASAEDVDRAIRAGFDYHIAKPADVDTVLKLVADAPVGPALRSVPVEVATGHHEMDAQHAALLSALAGVGTASAEASVDSMRSFERSAAQHFEYEERLMEDVSYPDLDGHRRLHAELLHRFAALREGLEHEQGTPGGLATLVTVAEGWVREHVAADRDLADHIRSARSEARPWSAGSDGKALEV